MVTSSGSGTISIIDPKQLIAVTKNLKEPAIAWLLNSPSQRRSREGNFEACIRSYQRMQDAYIFYDPQECIQCVRSLSPQRVTVIVSRDEPLDKKTSSQLLRMSNVVSIYQYKNEVSLKQIWADINTDTSDFLLDVLPSNISRTPVKKLDKATQLILMYHLLIDLLLRLPRTALAQTDFLTFCRYIHLDNTTTLNKISDFERTYTSDKAIWWYTCETFVYRTIASACRLVDLKSMFAIRYYLRDLYWQLKEIHDMQISSLRQPNLHVYRGKLMTTKQFHQLKTVGGIFVTRAFLSTTTNEKKARIFAGSEMLKGTDKVRVILSINLDGEQATQKPVAFVKEYSQFNEEDEVILPIGYVLRTASCHRLVDGTWQTEMVRGEQEVKIEREMIQFHLLEQTGATNPLLGMVTFLQTINKGKYVFEYSNLMARALDQADPTTAAQLRTTVQSNGIQIDEESGIQHSNDRFRRFNTFILVLIFLIIFVILAVLLPIFLSRNTNVSSDSSDVKPARK